MDQLLRQLRQSMAELSIQGEDFACQMWQMYAIFEEFLQTHIGRNHHQTSVNRPPRRAASSAMVDSSSSSIEEEHENRSPRHRRRPSAATFGNYMSSHSSHSAAARREQRIESILQNAEMESSRYHHGPSGKEPTTNGTSSKVLHPNSELCDNPLLETISAIETTFDETEDYGETPKCFSPQTNLSHERLTPVVATVDADKDSIDYAGSNSIDSGYKSSCPTPELSDGSFYGGGDGARSSGSASSLLGRTGDTEPRIAMGTRVMNRQHHLPQGAGANGSSTTSADVNLDHLMYLRQTLLSAMQQCEGVTATSPTTSKIHNGASSSASEAGEYSRSDQASASPTIQRLHAGPPRSHLADRDPFTMAGLGSRPRRMPSPTLGARQLRTPSPRPQRRLRRVSSPSLSSSSYDDSQQHLSSPIYNTSDPYLYRPHQHWSQGRGDVHSRLESNGSSASFTNGTDHTTSLRRSPRSPHSPRSPKSPRNSRTPSPMYFQKGYDSPTVVTSAQHPLRPSSPLQTQQSQYQKTVRFGMDGRKETQPRPEQSPGSVAVGKFPTGDTGPGSSGSLPLPKSKPILKDPICANLRSQFEFNPNDNVDTSTLEEEIDVLLYGRTKFRSVDNGTEYPCSYVTMMEDKYCKSSLAKVKKLRDKKIPASRHLSEPETVPSLHDHLSVEAAFISQDVGSAAIPSNSVEDSGGDDVDQNDVMKTRFSEVAKCMLEIIEDLQRQKLAGSNGSSSDTPSGDILVSSPVVNKEPVVGRVTIVDQKCSNSVVNSSSEVATPVSTENGMTDDGRLLNGADYHLYEEIIYSGVPASQRGRTPSASSLVGCHSTNMVPPPLPKRPNGGFRGNNGRSTVDDTMCDTSASSSQAFSTFPPPFLKGVMDKGAQRNRPKQRLNLYSIFREQRDRRSIGLSLEQEWRQSQQEDLKNDEEYGFKIPM